MFLNIFKELLLLGYCSHSIAYCTLKSVLDQADVAWTKVQEVRIESTAFQQHGE